MGNDNMASRQWMERPDDQRFLTLEELHNAVIQRKRESWTATPNVGALRVLPADNGGLGVECYDQSAGARRMLTPTNWGFGQLAQYAQAPAAYLRKLPPELAAINLQWGLEHNPMREDSLVLARTNGDNVLRAITSTSYGRIWDHQVVEAVQRVNADGRWVVPAASYATQNPKRATTLYASDRDVFIFLCDPSCPIEVPGENSPLYRGFYCWNSEVGSSVFGLKTFLYRYICDNRIIWGQTQVNELRIRHTGGAPERFAYEGNRYLRRYAQESTEGIVAGIQAAKAAELPSKTGERRADTVQDWLTKRGFTKAQAKGAWDSGMAENGDNPRSVWDIVNGVTAYARTISHTDNRVDLETKAGKLMDEVTR